MAKCSLLIIPLFLVAAMAQSFQIITQCPFESQCSQTQGPFPFGLPFPELPFIAPSDFQFISLTDFDNAHQSGDIEGRVFVGGNLNTGPGFSIGSNIPANVPFIDTSLVVGGSGTFPTGLIDTNSPIFVGNTWSSEEWDLEPVGGRIRSCNDLANPGACRLALVGATFQSTFCYCDTSDFLALLPANAAFTLTSNNVLEINCFSSNPGSIGSGTPNGAYIIDIDSATISATREYHFSSTCNPLSTYIFDVFYNSGDTVVFQGNQIVTLPEANVVYNFPCISGEFGVEILVETGVFGSILAPSSVLNQVGGTIVGKVVVGAVESLVQVNNPTCPAADS